jgi:hypothetical protein
VAEIKDINWLKSLCRAHTEANIKMIAGYATSEQVDPDLRLRAANILLERGWGKPQQDQTHEIKGEIKVTLRKMLSDEDDDG